MYKYATQRENDDDGYIDHHRPCVYIIIYALCEKTAYYYILSSGVELDDRNGDELRAEHIIL